MALLAVPSSALVACSGKVVPTQGATEPPPAGDDLSPGDSDGSGGSESGDDLDGGDADAPSTHDLDGGEADAPPTHAPHPPAFHRPAALPCMQARPAGMPQANCGFGSGGGACTADDECGPDAGKNGRCGCVQYGGLAPRIECSYDGCASDSDCGGVCVCREDPVHAFVQVPWYTSSTATFCLSQGNCRVDDECGDGGYCSPSPEPGCGATALYGYFCHESNDECADDGDCPGGNAYCAYDTRVGHWVCSTGMCPDG